MAFVISTSAAKQDKLFYVVSNVIIVNPSDHTCLLIKRSEKEIVHPGKWGFAGGKLEHEDVKTMIIDAKVDPLKGIDNILGKLVVREAKEESGLDIPEPTHILRNSVFVRPDGIPVLFVSMIGEYTGGEVITENNLEYVWVSKDQLAKYDCIDGVREEAAASIASFD